MFVAVLLGCFSTGRVGHSQKYTDRTSKIFYFQQNKYYLQMAYKILKKNKIFFLLSRKLQKEGL